MHHPHALGSQQQQQRRKELADIMVHMPWLQFACESKPSALHTNAPTAASMHAANACIATPPQDLVTPRGNECSPRAEHLERTRSLADLEAIYASCCPVATVPSRPHVMHAPQPARDGPCNGTSGHDVWFAEQLVELSGLLNSEPGVPRVPTPVPAPVEFDALSCMEGSGSVTAGNTGGHFGGCAPAAADSAAAVTAAAFAACTARSTAAPGSMRRRVVTKVSLFWVAPRPILSLWTQLDFQSFSKRATLSPPVSMLLFKQEPTHATEPGTLGKFVQACSFERGLCVRGTGVLG
jgi:hypothetical protein